MSMPVNMANAASAITIPATGVAGSSWARCVRAFMATQALRHGALALRRWTSASHTGIRGPVNIAHRCPCFSPPVERAKSATVADRGAMELSETSGPAVAAWLAGATGAAEVAVTEHGAAGRRCNSGELGPGRGVSRRHGWTASTRWCCARTRRRAWRRAGTGRRSTAFSRWRIELVSRRLSRSHLCQDTSVLGRPFYLMRRIAGEARGFKLVRDPLVRERGEALAARLGAELAKLHRVAPPVPALDFIPVPAGPAALGAGRRVSRTSRRDGQLRVRAGVGAGVARAARTGGGAAAAAACGFPHRQLSRRQRAS